MTLQVELTSSNIEYLQASMISQIDQGQRLRQHPRNEQAEIVDTCTHGVSWSYKRNSYRAFFVDSLKVKRCHYNTDLEKATEFTRSGPKPPAPDEGDEQSDPPCDGSSSDNESIIDH
jgi:hypothetical protein